VKKIGKEKKKPQNNKTEKKLTTKSFQKEKKIYKITLKCKKKTGIQ